MISKLANVLTVANQDNLMVGELYRIPPQSESHIHVHPTILSLPNLPSSLPASPQRLRPLTSAPPSPGLTWTLCLYNSFMEHGGVLCRHAGPWAGSTPPSVLLESICESSSIIVFALFVSSVLSDCCFCSTGDVSAHPPTSDVMSAESIYWKQNVHFLCNNAEK